MSGNDNQRWLTARHEAGHAVAAFHYDCPIQHVSIEPDGINLGTTRLAYPEVPQDAVVLFCGPLAEHDWAEFRPGNNVEVVAVGTDLDGLNILGAQGIDLNWWCRETMLFLSNPAVQQQIDQLANALVESGTLSADEARASAGFAAPILPGDHA